jgi:hypothetical protein
MKKNTKLNTTMAEKPPTCCETGSVAMFQTASLPIMYMRKVFAIAKDTA